MYTRRNIRDNCLSVFFQQLGGNLRYATDVGNAAHYYRQQERLMKHWLQLLGQNIHTLDYDELVHDPRHEIERLLEFVDVPWNDACLEFEKARSLVKTASVWQVREPLHRRSSGRWKNYEHFVGAVDDLIALDEDHAADQADANGEQI